jgi:hypothetical protein
LKKKLKQVLNNFQKGQRKRRTRERQEYKRRVEATTKYWRSVRYLTGRYKLQIKVIREIKKKARLDEVPFSVKAEDYGFVPKTKKEIEEIFHGGDIGVESIRLEKKLPKDVVLDELLQAIGAIDQIRAMEESNPNAYLRIICLFDYEFHGRVKTFIENEENVDFWNKGDAYYKDLTANCQWKVQHELFRVVVFVNDRIEVTQIKAPESYTGKSK